MKVIFKQILMLLLFTTFVRAGDIITLTYDQVVQLGLKQNLDLQMMRQDVRYQTLNEYKAFSAFLPTLSYSFQAVNNIELPVLVFMGRSFRIGTKYNFTHAFQLQYPLFTGGARLANLSIQRNSKKSLLQMLKGKKEDVVLETIEAYFKTILAADLLKVNKKAYRAAQANFNQVQKFYKAGTASQLDLLRAKTRLSQTLPALTSAENARRMSLEKLKFLLNLNGEDSLVVLDSLQIRDFLGSFAQLDLNELQKIALEHRSDLRGLQFQQKAIEKQKWLAGAQFMPQVVMSLSLQHQAFIENSNVQAKDYTRSKAAGIAVQIPLFEGGKSVLELQQAYLQEKKIALQKEQLEKAILMDVTNAVNSFQEARQNLQTLEQAFTEARETYRLAQLTYREGLSTQVDVLNAQTALTQSELQYRQGIFNYNIAQLQLLKAIGRLDILWE